MFDVIKAKGMTVRGFCRVGQEKFTYQYVRAIRCGKRAVPASDEFQEWVATTLQVPKEILFFEGPFANANERHSIGTEVTER